MNMDSTLACDKLELKKAQASYKRNLDRRLRRGNAKIKEGYYILLEVQNWKVRKLSEHTDGPFLVLNRPTLTFVIQRGDVGERVNSDLVEWKPTP